MCPFYWMQQQNNPEVLRERIIRHLDNMHSTERRVVVTAISQKLRGGHGCISGRSRQMGCIRFIFDRDCMLDLPRFNYLSRSAVMIRQMLTPRSAPPIRFDRHVAPVLTDKGSCYQWKADVQLACKCLQVTPRWWVTKPMAELILQEFVLSKGFFLGLTMPPVYS